MRAETIFGGAMGKLRYDSLSDRGLVGGLIGDIGDDINAIPCSALGPNFLQILSNNNDCPNGFLLPTIFKSYENFCKYYYNACPRIQNCLTRSAIKLRINVEGIVDVAGTIAKCCANCTDAAPQVGLNSNLIAKLANYPISFSKI